MCPPRQLFTAFILDDCKAVRRSPDGLEGRGTSAVGDPGGEQAGDAHGKALRGYFPVELNRSGMWGKLEAEEEARAEART